MLIDLFMKGCVGDSRVERDIYKKRWRVCFEVEEVILGQPSHVSISFTPDQVDFSRLVTATLMEFQRSDQIKGCWNHFSSGMLLRLKNLQLSSGLAVWCCLPWPRFLNLYPRNSSFEPTSCCLTSHGLISEAASRDLTFWICFLWPRLLNLPHMASHSEPAFWWHLLNLPGTHLNLPLVT